MRVAPARSVRIAVPAYSGALAKETQRSIVEGLKALKAEGIEVDAFDLLPGCCYLDHARNILVARFLRGAATDLLFIDADVGFGPEDLLRLCAATRPMVAGIYPKKTEPPEWPVSVSGEEIWADGDGLIDCWMVPTGFLRINRAVFEAIDAPAYESDANGTLQAFFKTDIRGTYWGEDVEFCRLVREAGIPIKAFAEMDFQHVDNDGRVYSGNWGRWLKSQMKEAA